MNLGKTLTDLATAPVRVGLAVADAGLGIANNALGMAQRTLGETNSRGGSASVSFAHMLGIDDAVERAIGQRQLAGVADLEADVVQAWACSAPRAGDERLAQVDADGGAGSNQRSHDPQVITSPAADI